MAQRNDNPQAPQKSARAARVIPEVETATSPPMSHSSHLIEARGNESEIAQLRELTEALIGAVSTLQMSNQPMSSQRDPVLTNLVDNVNAATRSLTNRSPVALANAYGVDQRSNCDCGPCGCVSDDCCMFKIEITHARATAMQIDPSDSNVLPPTGSMEIRFFASIDGIGAVIPNLFQFISLDKNLGQSGMWVKVLRSIGTVNVCKGKPKHITIEVDALEGDLSDGSVAEVLMLRDEQGTASVNMALDCCLSVPLTTTLEIILNNNGLGGGAIEVKIVATKVCC